MAELSPVGVAGCSLIILHKIQLGVTYLTSARGGIGDGDALPEWSILPCAIGKTRLTALSRCGR
jgi:hypothetical protein